MPKELQFSIANCGFGICSYKQKFSFVSKSFDSRQVLHELVSSWENIGSIYKCPKITPIIIPIINIIKINFDFSSILFNLTPPRLFLGESPSKSS